jgi:hypothetical protein
MAIEEREYSLHMKYEYHRSFYVMNSPVVIVIQENEKENSNMKLHSA